MTPRTDEGKGGRTTGSKEDKNSWKGRQTQENKAQFDHVWNVKCKIKQKSEVFVKQFFSVGWACHQPTAWKCYSTISYVTHYTCRPIHLKRLVLYLAVC